MGFFDMFKKKTEPAAPAGPIMVAADAKGTVVKMEDIPDEVFAGCAFYMNRSLRAALRLQIQNRANVQFTFDNYAGKSIGQIEHLILAGGCDPSLLARIIRRLQDLIHPPFITGCCA